MSDAERQQRAREARRVARDETRRTIVALRVALTKISDTTSERMRTKADLQTAMDRIGTLAADALTLPY